MSDTPISDQRWKESNGNAHRMSDIARDLERMAGELLEALWDMNAGWKYIRDQHGDLYGVGWDRAQNKADAALIRLQAMKDAAK